MLKSFLLLALAALPIEQSATDVVAAPVETEDVIKWNQTGELLFNSSEGVVGLRDDVHSEGEVYLSMSHPEVDMDVTMYNERIPAMKAKEQASNFGDKIVKLPYFGEIPFDRALLYFVTVATVMYWIALVCTIINLFYVNKWIARTARFQTARAKCRQKRQQQYAALAW